MIWHVYKLVERRIVVVVVGVRGGDGIRGGGGGGGGGKGWGKGWGWG
jgi:hypothetical protein